MCGGLGFAWWQQQNVLDCTLHFLHGEQFSSDLTYILSSLYKQCSYKYKCTNCSTDLNHATGINRTPTSNWHGNFEVWNTNYINEASWCCYEPTCLCFGPLFDLDHVSFDLDRCDIWPLGHVNEITQNPWQNMFSTWWPWPLRYDLNLHRWPRHMMRNVITIPNLVILSQAVL